MSLADSNSLPNSIGFIGLGAMGKPMVINLVKRLPVGSHIFIHDVVAAAVEEVCASFPDAIVKCANAKEVAEKSVRP